MGATISTDLQTSGAVLVLAGELDVRSTSEIRSALHEHIRVHGSYTDGRVLESFTPRWNSLSLFKVPALHCVSYVTPWAAGPRLAVTGWLRGA